MTNRLSRVLIVPDTHAPYHDVDAWELMLEVGRDLKPDILVHMGDLLDCYSVSRHSKDPARATTLDSEVKVGRECRAQLDELGAKKKVFTAGNHEHRLERYMQEKAPELHGLLDIPRLLELEENGWDYVEYRDDHAEGVVHFTHDTGHSGRHAIYRALDTYGSSNVTAHTHRMAYIVEGSVAGRPALSASFGWLGDLSKIDYLHKAKAARDWCLAFGTGYLDQQTGHLFAFPHVIVEYRTIFNGKLYKAPRRRKK